MPIIYLCLNPLKAPKSHADGSTGDLVRFQDSPLSEVGVVDGEDELEVELANGCQTVSVESFIRDPDGKFSSYGATTHARLDLIARSTGLTVSPRLYAKIVMSSLPGPIVRTYEATSTAASDLISGVLHFFKIQ